MAASAHRVGVVVVAYNTKRFWPRLKAALEAQTFRDWRLIVVDNASAPDERLHATDLPANATLIQSEVNLGFAAANNLAVRDFDCEFIALLNPDAFPEPTWLAELLAAAERWPQAAAFGSTQWLAHEPGVCDGEGDELFALGLPYRAGHRRRVTQLAPEGPTFSACAAAALFRRVDFEAMGGFDPDFFAYCEDLDLGYRLRLIGRISVQAPRAVVAHVSGGVSARTSKFAARHGARNRLWTFVKNTPPLLFWPLLPLHLLVSAVWLIAAAIRNGHGAGLAGFGEALANFATLLRKRADVQTTRTVSSAAIASGLVWSPIKLALRRRKSV